MKISVIIPVLGHEIELKKLLESLTKQTLPIGDFEVLVIHNSDTALELGSEFPFELKSIAEPQGFSYSARNSGIRLSRGDVLAFTDADCVAAPGWLASALEIIQQDPKALVAGQITVTVNREPPSLAAKHQMVFAFDQQVNVDYKRGIPTANLVVHREAFNHLGLFDSNMVSGGDAEWTLRAIKHGYRAVFAPSAIVFHPARETIRGILQQRLRHSLAIESLPTISARLSWFARWVSPNQGVAKRLLKRGSLRTRERGALFALNLFISASQLVFGLVRLLSPTASGGRNRKVTAGEKAREVTL